MGRAPLRSRLQPLRIALLAILLGQSLASVPLLWLPSSDIDDPAGLVGSTAAQAAESAAAGAAGAAGEEPAEPEPRWPKLKRTFRKGMRSSMLHERAKALDLLAGVDEPEAAEALAGVVLGEDSRFIQYKAVNMLSACRHPETIRGMMRLVSKRSLDDEPRLLLLEALGRIRSPVAYPVLVELAQSKDIRYRIVACEGLGRLREPIPEVLRILSRYSQPSSPYPLRLTALESLALIPNRASIPPLVVALETPGRIREIAGRGLILLTGRTDMPVDHGRWVAWMREEGASFMVDPAVSGGKTLADIKLDEMDSYDFYGIRFHAKRVLFVIDRSGSMRTGAMRGGKGISRMRAVQTELNRLISQLDESVAFNVVFFAGGKTTWKGSILHPATDANKAAAKTFVRSVTPMGTTSTDSVMVQSIRYFADKEGVETIYLLTDGAPFRNRQYLDMDEIRGQIRETNRFRKVQIHTVGCFYGEQEMGDLQEPPRERLVAFLEGIAWDNDGYFRELTE